MEELGFCADLHRPLAQAKPLTAGPSELTYLEFGSPNATLFITKTENLGENPPSALKGAARCAALHRPLAQAKPLTAGPSELTYLEFGSPNATLFITKTENLGENPDRKSTRLN